METNSGLKTEPLLEIKPPEDCAVVVSVVYPCEDKSCEPRLQFKRVESTGWCHRAITFRERDARIGAYLSNRAKPGYEFKIAFSLRDDGASGGFAGMKIWPAKERKPERWLRPLPGAQPEEITLPTVEETVKIIFILEACYDDRGRATKLLLRDPLTLSGEYNYCIGVYKELGSDKIVEHDPQIYNTGDVGDYGEEAKAAKDEGDRPVGRKHRRGTVKTG